MSFLLMTGGDGRDRAAYERDGELVLAARAGDDAAFAELFNRWFDPVYDAARRIVGDREIAAEVAQDTFLAVWEKLGDLREPSTFGAFTLRTARNRALNRSERERRSVAVDDQDLVPVIDAARPSVDTGDVITQNEGDALVWAASAALGERDASLLDLHLRHGLTAPELAEEMGVTANNAHQLLFRMKKKLGVAIEAWVLWRGGSPSCLALAGDLERAGVDGFSADAVRVINRHVNSCHECDERKAAMLAPEALFAAVPIAAAAPSVREGVANALRNLGVPATTSPPTSTGASPGETGDSSAGSSGGTTNPAGSNPNAAAIAAEHDAPVSTAARRAVLAGVGLLVVLLLLGGGIAVSRSRTPSLIEAAIPTTAGTAKPSPPPTAASGSAPIDTATDESPVAADPEQPVVTDSSTDPTGDPRNASSTTTSPGNVVNPNANPNGNTNPNADPNVIVNPTVTMPTTAQPNIVTLPPTTPPTDPPPPPPPPSPPTVDSFTAAVHSGPPCGSTQHGVTLKWTTTNATSVTILGPGAPAAAQAADNPTGLVVCGPLPGPNTYIIKATGPGGTVNGPPRAA